MSAVRVARDEGALGSFSDFLEAKHLKLTKQREIILKEFIARDEHLSAEELYARLRGKHPGIGQATVFRNLRLIAEAGLAQEVRLSDRTTRYEQNAKGGHHDHILCLSCGAMIEFKDDRIENLQAEIAKQFGVTLLRHRLDLYVLCKKCAKKSELSEGEHAK